MKASFVESTAKLDAAAKSPKKSASPRTKSPRVSPYKLLVFGQKDKYYKGDKVDNNGKKPI